ncbi:STAS domain-containing protein [Terasakiella sp. SH-1]|uniref:STAS domain-containing protein n=1 Tax=Terasakiella sp. SH-1 TaxID=2560057 RepID=UPI0010742E62|nr:STAS domain-containing protein [Terasakiella sp. SH-1]
MKLERREDNSIIIFELEGDVDLETSPQLREALLTEVNAGKSIVVSMADVSYIDSSGIACLVEAYQTGRRTSAGFALANISDKAIRVFQLARLDKIFTIHDTISEAVTELTR